jgi:hypothetical protein
MNNRILTPESLVRHPLCGFLLGRAALKFDYALEADNGTSLMVTVNGQAGSLPLSLPPTGGWATWAESDFYAINLQPGDDNIIRFEGGGVNIQTVQIFLPE